MSDPFQSLATGMTGPARNAVSVTPSDVADLAITARALYIGVGGSLRITTAGGDTVTLLSVPAGVIQPITASRVWATGTTAASIVAVW